MEENKITKNGFIKIDGLIVGKLRKVNKIRYAKLLSNLEFTSDDLIKIGQMVKELK